MDIFCKMEMSHSIIVENLICHIKLEIFVENVLVASISFIPLSSLYFSYIFDRMFYNDSSLPRTLKPPKYFEIKVIKNQPHRIN